MYPIVTCSEATSSPALETREGKSHKGAPYHKQINNVYLSVKMNEGSFVFVSFWVKARLYEQGPFQFPKPLKEVQLLF